MNQFIFEHLILVLQALCGEGKTDQSWGEGCTFDTIVEGTCRVTEEDGEGRSNEIEHQTFYHRKITAVTLIVIGAFNRGL